MPPKQFLLHFYALIFLEMSNFANFFLYFLVFCIFFLIKGLFHCYIKAHKKFSRSHLTLKVAPMCSKAHIIKHLNNYFICFGFEMKRFQSNNTSLSTEIRTTTAETAVAPMAGSHTFCSLYWVSCSFLSLCVVMRVLQRRSVVVKILKIIIQNLSF